MPRFGDVQAAPHHRPRPAARRTAGHRRAAARDRRHPRRTTADRPSRGCASSRRIRGTCRHGSSTPWPDATRSASTSTCRSRPATTRCSTGWAASTRSTRTSTWSSGCVRRCPGIALTTDVIVGFCGETDAQFQQTLELLRTVRYDAVFAAAFSPRPGHARQPPRRRRARGGQAGAAERVAGPPGRHRSRTQSDVGRARRSRSSWTRSGRPGRMTTTHPATRLRRAWPAGRATTSSSISTADLTSSAGSWSVAIDHAGPYALTGRRVDGDA